MVHRPLGASNLLDTWRRCYGDAKITCCSYQDHESSKTPGWGTVRFKVSATRRAPWRRHQQHLPERMKESGRNERREETHRCVQIIFLSSFAENIPSLLTSPQFRCCVVLNCTWKCNVFVEASVLLLCSRAWVQGGLCFMDACTGFQRD